MERPTIPNIRSLAATVITALSLPAGATTYSQDFDGFANGTTALGDGSVMSGTANIQNQQLELTRDGVAGGSASFTIPAMSGSSGGWTATFNLTISDGPGSGDPADGLSFNYGNFAMGELGSAEEGMSGVGSVSDNISFEVDTWMNFDAEQGVNIAEKVGGATNDLAFTNGPILNDGTTVGGLVTVTYDSGNGASFSTTGLNTNANFANIPVSFVGNDAYHFCISARVGGANQTVLIDDLVVTTVAVTQIETGGPVISEFCADNDDLIEDEDLNSSDWLEIYNGQNSSVNLAGHYLTDDPAIPAKWSFPAVTVPAYGYLLVFASGKDRSDPAGLLHTDFTLEKSGGYLALVAPDGVTVLSDYTFGAQFGDISYGELGDARTLGFFETPTPGSKNGGIQSPDGPAEDVRFDRIGGLFSNSTTLTILPPVSPTAVVRYTTDNTIPTESSLIYGGTPFNITNTTTIRARTFDPGRLPGEVKSRTLIELASNVQNFTSALPIVVADSRGANIDDGNRSFRFTYGVVIDTDPADGFARMTGPTDFTGRGGMHVRGQSSSGFPKKQYAWETWNNENEDKDVSLLGMPSESDWILHAPYSDKTLMRNVMVYNCARDLWGNDGGVRTQFVELFFNQNGGTVSMSDYQGVYVLMEKIKRANDRIEVEKLNYSVTDPELIQGGYIFKKDKAPHSLPWTTSVEGVPLDMHDPESLNTAQFNYLKGHVNDFETALHGSAFEDPAAGYPAYIDVTSFIDNHLFVEMFKEIDGYRISAYYVKPRYGRIRALPVWDYNLALGNANYLEGEIPQGWYYPQLSGTNYYWYQRLFQSTEFKLAYWDRFWKLRRSNFDTASLMSKIDELDAELDLPNASGESAVTRNFDEWNILGSYLWPNAGGYASRTTHQAEVDWMKNWLTQRMTWIETQSEGTSGSAQPPGFNQYGGTAPAGFQLTMTDPNGWTGSTIYYTLDGSDPRVPGNSAGTSTTFVAETSACEALVPSTANGGSTLAVTQWTNPAPPPNAANWTAGTQGVGYERPPSTDYAPQINLNVESGMYDNNETVYIRIPFTATAGELAELTELTLWMKYNDSFVAYLNGTEVTRDAARSPASVTWDSGATFTHSDSSAVNFIAFDITAHIASLQPGDNMLAIHGLNRGTTSSDALWRCKLDATAGSGGSPSPTATAYTGPVPLAGGVEVKARVRSGANWSPMSQGLFLVDAVAASASNIVISEFNYRSAAPSAAEIDAGYTSRSNFDYVELLNIDPIRSVNLDGVQFSDGITFTFDNTLAPEALLLPPGGRVIIADLPEAFAFRYGSGAIVAGNYGGGLNNDGERITFLDASLNPIKDFIYDIAEPWPVAADGAGYSLVLIDPDTNPPHSDPFSWRSSVGIGGTPGGDDSIPFLGDPDEDDDNDGQTAFLEYAMGTADHDASSHRSPSIGVEAVDVGGEIDDYLVFEFQVNLAGVGVDYTIESAADLSAWADATADFVYLSTANNGDGTATVRYRSAVTFTLSDPQIFFRLRVSN